MPNSNKKKILYVENGIGYGGAIICLRHLVRNLDSSQFYPIVVTGRTGPQYQEIAGEAQWLHIRDKRINIVNLRERLAKVSWLNRFAFLRFIANQVLSRADDLLNFLPFFLRLFWTAKKSKADLIHANNEPICNRASLLVAKVLRIPSVCHVRGGDQSALPLNQWAYSLPDHFISVSDWVAKNVQKQLRVPETKISVVYDGIALDKLDINADGDKFRKAHGIAPGAFAVGLVGLLIPWKGQELFLDAAKLLKAKIPNLTMVIVGGTPNECAPYEKRLRRRIQDEQLSDLVVLTGHISKMEMAYNGLDVVVSASMDPEPLGTVVIEAMAMGRMLIAPNHGGAAEMMQHEITGLLFAPRDASSLAEAIERAHADGELRKTLGANARAVALNTFNVGTHAEIIQSIYQELLKHHA